MGKNQVIALAVAIVAAIIFIWAATIYPIQQRINETRKGSLLLQTFRIFEQSKR